MKKPNEVVSEATMSAAVVFSEIWPIIVRHKKTTVALVVFELWVHSLVWQHLHDIKTISEVFPIFGHLIGAK